MNAQGTADAGTDANLTALLLGSDAASLAIENSGDSDILKGLAEFGRKLTKYANMIIEQDRMKQESLRMPMAAPARRASVAEPDPASVITVTPPQDANASRDRARTMVSNNGNRGEEEVAAGGAGAAVEPDEVMSDHTFGTRYTTDN